MVKFFKLNRKRDTWGDYYGEYTIEESYGDMYSFDNIIYFVDKVNNKYVATEETSGMKLLEANTIEEIHNCIKNKIDRIKALLKSDEVINNITMKNVLILSNKINERRN